MAQTQARPWWDDVEHLRDDLEQRRVERRESDREHLVARRAARARRREELEAAREHARVTVPDGPPVPEGPPRRRFERGPQSAFELTPMREFEEAFDGPPPAAAGRRTVQITGRTVPAPPTTTERAADAGQRGAGVERRRPPRRAIDRVGHRPDRVALWALLMGLVLILVAVGTADASTLPQ